MRGALRDRRAGSSGQRRRPRAEGRGRGGERPCAAPRLGALGPGCRPGGQGRAGSGARGGAVQRRRPPRARENGGGRPGPNGGAGGPGAAGLRRARSRRPGGSAGAGPGPGPLPPAGCSPGRALGRGSRLPGELPLLAAKLGSGRTDGPALEMTKPGSLGRAGQGEPGQGVCLVYCVLLFFNCCWFFVVLTPSPIPGCRGPPARSHLNFSISSRCVCAWGILSLWVLFCFISSFFFFFLARVVI